MAPRKASLTRATSSKKAKRNCKTQEPLQVGEASNAGAEGDNTTSQPPKKRGRGPGIIRKLTEIVEDRPIIWPVGNRAFTCKEDPQEITAAITRLALNHMPGPLRSYHAFDETTKKNIEFLFLKKFRYREGKDLDRCRHVFDAIAAKRYSEELYEARNKHFKKFGMDIQKWKEPVPHWSLDHPYWHDLCEIFATDDFSNLSTTNRHNRTKKKGRKIAHHGGSASAHQHFQKLTTLNNGKEPPMRALFIHLHCAKENGKSPIVAKMEAANAAAAAAALESAPAEGHDANPIINPSRNEATTQLEGLDIDSLQFTNDKTQEVYEKVNNMMADQDNSSVDESTMFLSAVGGSSRDRVKGFGCLLDDKVQKNHTRNRPQHSLHSASGLTTTGDETNLSRSELQVLLAESDRRQAEERVERKKELAQYDFYIKQLYTMFGTQVPIQQAQLQNSETQQAMLGNLTIFQGHGSGSQPSHEGASHIQPGVLQGLPCLTPPNQGGTFTALLNQSRNDEHTTDGTEMNPWFGSESSFNVNRPI